MNICLLGDSIAKGVIYNEETGKYAFSKKSFSKLLSDENDMNIKNYAKFGCTILKGTEILNKRFKTLSDYDYSILEFGGNDCNHNWSSISEEPLAAHPANVEGNTFMATYSEMITNIRKMGSKPILLTLPPLEPTRFFEWVSKGLNKENIMKYLNNDVNNIFEWHNQYNRDVKKLAIETNTPLMDIRSAFTSLGDYSQYLCVDGMHPNEKGHRLIADTIKNNAGYYFA